MSSAMCRRHIDVGDDTTWHVVDVDGVQVKNTCVRDVGILAFNFRVFVQRRRVVVAMSMSATSWHIVDADDRHKNVEVYNTFARHVILLTLCFHAENTTFCLSFCNCVNTKTVSALFHSLTQCHLIFSSYIYLSTIRHLGRLTHQN